MVRNLETYSTDELVMALQGFVANLLMQVELGCAGRVEFWEGENDAYIARVTMKKADGSKGKTWFLGHIDDDDS